MNFNFTKKKLCRVPTVWGWLALCTIFLGTVSFVVSGLDSFLSVNKPLDAKVMVIEGWLPDYALQQAVQELSRSHYVKLLAAGGPLEKGFYLSEYKTYAALTAATLIKLGVDSAAIIIVPAPQAAVDRTYASACAVKKWIERSGMSLHAINLVSLGPHARRSRLLYEQAFNASPKLSASVGAIAYSDRMYDGRRWWKTSSGFRTVTGEAIAYLYARFFFRPKSGERAL
jgi:hypothetical protein